MNLLRFFTLATVCCVLNCGCEEAVQHAKDDTGSHTHSHGDGTHSHSHDHTDDSHAHDQETEPDGIHGINGGHVFSFEPADYVGEWLVTNDDDVTKIFILDKNASSNVAVKVENFELRKGDSVFTLDPENTDEEGKTAIFSLNDQDLSIAINLGVEVTMQIGDQKYHGKISALPPHDH